VSEQQTIVTGIRPGLQIRELTGCDGRRFIVADWLCACGHHERARGKEDVADLAGRVRVGHCPHTSASKEAA
jgi:hypothetical protein